MKNKKKQEKQLSKYEHNIIRTRGGYYGVYMIENKQTREKQPPLPTLRTKRTAVRS